MFIQLRRIGNLLADELPREIRMAGEKNWDADSLQRIADIVRKYVTKACFVLRLHTVFVLAITILMVGRSVTGTATKIEYVLCEILVVAALIAASALLYQLPFVVRHLALLPGPAYREMTMPLRMHVDLASIAVNIPLMLVVFFSWQMGGSRPIFFIVALLWIVLPWIAFLRGNDRLLLAIRAGQIAVLIPTALLSLASPVPIAHFQYWGSREFADTIRPRENREITHGWKSLRWFSQEGAAEVWYSSGHGSDAPPYRLFSGPGRDPKTNEELKPVLDLATKNRIESALAEFDAARARAAQADLKARQITEFLLGSPNAGKVDLALLVTANGAPDAKLAREIAAALKNAGIVASPDVFSNAFMASPHFKRLVAGKEPAAGEFDAGEYCLAALVCEVDISYKEIVAGTVSADMTVHLRRIDSQTRRSGVQATYSLKGAGFSEGEANALALERLSQEINKDRNQLQP